MTDKEVLSFNSSNLRLEELYKTRLGKPRSIEGMSVVEDIMKGSYENEEFNFSYLDISPIMRAFDNLTLLVRMIVVEMVLSRKYFNSTVGMPFEDFINNMVLNLKYNCLDHDGIMYCIGIGYRQREAYTFMKAFAFHAESLGIPAIIGWDGQKLVRMELND